MEKRIRVKRGRLNAFSEERLREKLQEFNPSIVLPDDISVNKYMELIEETNSRIRDVHAKIRPVEYGIGDYKSAEEYNRICDTTYAFDCPKCKRVAFESVTCSECNDLVCEDCIFICKGCSTRLCDDCSKVDSLGDTYCKPCYRVRMSGEMECNMCDGTIEYTYYEHRTHIWVCTKCPNVQLEFIEDSNAEDLVDFLTKAKRKAENER